MNQPQTKRQQIEHSVTTMIAFASASIFILFFCIFSAHSLWDKMGYQSKVINDDTSARNLLSSDVTTAAHLKTAYENFNQASSNLLGQSNTGDTNDNTKIILDALPSTYDYPATITSISNLLSSQGVNIDSISGTDNSATISSGSGGAPVAMPFSFSVDGPYQNIENVINEFQSSIRPFQLQTIDLSGDQTDITLSVTGQTYYQPPSQFSITKEAVH